MRASRAQGANVPESGAKAHLSKRGVGLASHKKARCTTQVHRADDAREEARKV